MAEEVDVEDFFLQTIPSLLRQARRNIHSDDITVLEYFERRLGDHVYVVSAIILQCEQRSVSDDLLELLYQVHNEISSLNDQFQRFCSMQRDYSTEMGFSCPIEHTGNAGRPRLHIPQEVIAGLHDIHGVSKQVAIESRVLYRTILRRRSQYGMPVSSSYGPRITYSDVTDENLCQAVREILQLMPNAGETYVIGALRSRGIRVQRWRMRESIYTVDPVSRALRRSRGIVRRTYNVPCPNALW